MPTYKDLYLIAISEDQASVLPARLRFRWRVLITWARKEQFSTQRFYNQERVGRARLGARNEATRDAWWSAHCTRRRSDRILYRVRLVKYKPPSCTVLTNAARAQLHRGLRWASLAFKPNTTVVVHHPESDSEDFDCLSDDEVFLPRAWAPRGSLEFARFELGYLMRRRGPSPEKVV